MSNLYFWRGDIEADVRIVMRHERQPDLSLDACKEWTRGFIQFYVPWWTPGTPLKEVELMLIGGAFSSKLRKAKGE